MGFRANNTDVEDIVGDFDDQSLGEVESCKHFLIDTEMENGRHRVFKIAMSSFDKSFLNDKLDYVFKELKCAAKVNFAFGFVLKNIEDGMCRYFYAHENNTIMEATKLCVYKLIWLIRKTECRKWILLIFVPEREPIQSGNFTNLQIKQFLLRYSKTYPWVV